jgi:hypothetical protein
MRSKPADLSASLVAVKGTATPSPDMTGRAVGPVIDAVPQPAELAEAPPKPAARSAARIRRPPEPEAKEANLSPLNFRVAGSFRREFRTYAATHDLKLNELLRLCFEAYRRQQRD